MKVPLRDYLDEGKFWVIEGYNEIFVKYVSNDASHGGDIGLWPASFAKYVAAFLAYEISPQLNNDVDSDKLFKKMEWREKQAKSKDAIKSPSRPLPKGSWINSRLAGHSRDTGDRV